MDARVYELTDLGLELEPVFATLAAWGSRSPVVPLRGGLSDDSVMLGLRSLFAAGDPHWNATYEVRLERETYTVVVTGGALTELARGPRTAAVDQQADATLHTDPYTLQELLLASCSLSAAVDSGRVGLTGDHEAAQRLFDALQHR